MNIEITKRFVWFIRAGDSEQTLLSEGSGVLVSIRDGPGQVGRQILLTANHVVTDPERGEFYPYIECFSPRSALNQQQAIAMTVHQSSRPLKASAPSRDFVMLEFPLGYDLGNVATPLVASDADLELEASELVICGFPSGSAWINATQSGLVRAAQFGPFQAQGSSASGALVGLIGGGHPQGGCSGGGVFWGPKLVGIYFASQPGFATEVMLPVKWLRAWGQQQAPVIEFLSSLDSLPADVRQIPLNDQSPYRGLLYFDENDTGRFFGRDGIRQSILRALNTDRLLVLYGPSGSGKSSLLRAGIVTDWVKGHPGSRRVIFLPNDDPFYSLASQLGEPLTNAPKVNWLVELLASRGRDTSWLLAMDQGEQLFTRTPETRNIGEEPYYPRTLFLEALAQAATDPALDCRIVVALRDEFFGDIRASEKFQKLADRYFIRIPELTEKDLEEIVSKPAATHGVAVEPRLVKAIIDDMAGEPGALPLLQLALGEVWKREKEHSGLEGRLLNYVTYYRAGGLEKALQTRVKEVTEGFDSGMSDLLRRVMLRFVQTRSEEGKLLATSQRVAKAGFEEAELNLLKTLENRGGLIVSHQGDGGQFSYELAHEKLLEAWPQYREWISEAGELLRFRDQIEADALSYGKVADPNKKREELWTGNRLTRALTELDAKSFQRVGAALSQPAERFLEDGRSERNRRQKEETDRLRREKQQAEELAKALKDRAELSEASGKKQKEAASKLRRWVIVASGAAGAALILLAISLFMWRVAIDQRIAAERAQAEAEEQARNQEDIANEVSKLGYSMLVGEIYGKLRDYYEEHQPDERDESVLIIQARVLEDYCNFLLARGEINEAYKSCSQCLEIRKRLTRLVGRINDLAWQQERQQDLARSLDILGEIFAAQNHYPDALKYCHEAIDKLEELVNRNSDIHDSANVQLRIDLSNSFEHLGDMFEVQNNYLQADSNFGQSGEIRSTLLNNSTVNKRQQDAAEVGLASSVDKQGSVRKAEGKYQEALVLYRKSFDIRKQLVQRDQQNVPWKEQLASSFEHIGEVLRLQGQFSQALNNYSESVNILQKLADRDPLDVQRKYRLSLGLERRGDIRFNLGEPGAALDDFGKCYSILQALVTSDPENLQWQRDLSTILESRGDAFEKVSQLQEAKESFSQSLKIRRQLVNSADESWLEQELSSAFDRLGNISTDQNNLDDALYYYRTSLRIRENFANQYPADAAWQTYLAFSYEHIADSLYAEKRLGQALPEFRKALSIRTKLADAVPEDAERQARVAHLCWRIAEAMDKSKSSDREEAMRLLAQGRAIFKALSEKNELSAPQKEDFGALERVAADLARQDTATTQ